MSNTKEFWEYLSTYYTNYPMINDDADYEMNFISEKLSEMKELVCLGVADGTRDPLQILKINSNIESMILVDISTKLLNLCKNNIKEFNHIPTQYFDQPIHELKLNVTKRPTTMFIGTYNAKYIIKSLGIYLKNRELGENFDLAVLTEENGKLIRKNNIQFKIDDYTKFIPQILKMQDDNFLGYSIKTEKEFVTHHYHVDNFSNFITKSNVFKKHHVHYVGDRHVIFQFGEGNERIITCLNNVIGNIPHNLQIETLSKINQLFF